jgi:hypothetical protein
MALPGYQMGDGCDGARLADQQGRATDFMG